jgi:hypothetical protein
MIVNYPTKNLNIQSMKRNSTSAMGALHPILFFLFVYGFSLFLAIFVCRTVYNSLNSNVSATEQPMQTAYPASGATALR